MALPFHGIFSALSDEGTAKETSPLRQSPVRADAQERRVSGEAGRLAVDIYEQDDYIIIRAPIAGVRLSDLDIEVNGSVVTIRGQRRPPDTVPHDQFYLEECYWGPFSRTVTLPSEVDAKRIRATFNRDCILKVLIPKEDRVKIVRITEG